MTSQFLSLLALGIGLGAVYSLGAVGLSLILRFTGILHFAHGATFILASYALLAIADRAGLPLAVAIVAALVVSVLAGVAVYELVYRPLEHRKVGELGFVISAFGILIISENAMTLGFGSTAQRVPMPHWSSTTYWSLGGTTIRSADLVSVVIALLAIGGLAWFRQRTRMGLLVRALERNKQLAADLHISYRRYAPLVFGAGSLLAGGAAVLSSLTVPVAPDGGLQWTVSVYIAMAVGGTGSIWSSAVGGLALGILSTVPDLWLPGSWNVALAFGVLVAVLLILPNGLVPAGGRAERRASVFRVLARQLSGAPRSVPAVERAVVQPEREQVQR